MSDDSAFIRSLLETVVSEVTEFSIVTNRTVNVVASSTILLEANPARVFARIVNNTTTTIWLRLTDAAIVGRGEAIRANTSYTINSSALFTGQINAVSSDGPVIIDLIEGRI